MYFILMLGLTLSAPEMLGGGYGPESPCSDRNNSNEYSYLGGQAERVSKKDSRACRSKCQRSTQKCERSCQKLRDRKQKQSCYDACRRSNQKCYGKC